jgi:integrase
MLFTMYAVSGLAGLRLGEVCGLRKSDVELDKRIRNVRRSFDDPAKSGKPRMVPILDDLLPALQVWLDGLSTELVFTGAKGKMLRRDAPYFRPDRNLGRVLERAGFPRTYISFHGFRHTFASLYMMAGGDLFRLQKLLGHQSIETTQRYAHLAPDAFKEDFGCIRLRAG